MEDPTLYYNPMTGQARMAHGQAWLKLGMFPNEAAAARSLRALLATPEKPNGPDAIHIEREE